MTLTNIELLKEFSSRVREEYPDLTDEQIKEIAFSPWRVTKEGMESNRIQKFRLKYFGSFQVYKGRAIGMLERTKKAFQDSKIAPKEFFRIKTMIENYLDEQS